MTISVIVLSDAGGKGAAVLDVSDRKVHGKLIRRKTLSSDDMKSFVSQDLQMVLLVLVCLPNHAAPMPVSSYCFCMLCFVFVFV